LFDPSCCVERDDDFRLSRSDGHPPGHLELDAWPSTVVRTLFPVAAWRRSVAVKALAERDLGRQVPGTVSTETAPSDAAARERFIEGFVTASLVFCVGPLTILGSLSDGLGRGADQLILKAALGAGVMASVVAIIVVQGSLTLVGILVGSALPEAQLASITATGGLLLLGVGLRLLQIRAVPVGNLLPALLVAPALVWIVAAFR
jgi:uncharacterized protein